MAVSTLAAIYKKAGCNPKTLSAKKLVFVDLFSGTGSMASQARIHGITNVITVDIKHENNPTFACDIMDINDDHEFCVMMDDYIKNGMIIIMHASPPCNEFSRMNTTGIRDLDSALALVKKAVALMNKYSHIWCLENPATGLLWTLPYANDHLSFRTNVDYCAYGGIMKKATTFAFSSQLLLDGFQGKTCPGNKECDACFVDRETGNLAHADWEKIDYAQRISIPPLLCRAIVGRMVSFSCDIAPEVVAELQNLIEHADNGGPSGCKSTPATKRFKTCHEWDVDAGDVLIFMDNEPCLKHSCLNISMCEPETPSGNFARAICVKEASHVHMSQKTYVVTGYNYIGTFTRMTKRQELSVIAIPVDEMMMLLSMDKDTDIFRITESKKDKIMWMLG